MESKMEVECFIDKDAGREKREEKYGGAGNFLNNSQSVDIVVSTLGKGRVLWLSGVDQGM